MRTTRRASAPTVRRSREQAGAPVAPTVPEPFAGWFAARGWTPRAHQLALIEAARRRRSTLLIAPTGAGKTLAGFLPSLLSLAQRTRANRGRGLHTLYISPLKALAVDVARNLMAPIAEMQLKIRTETRTGDTSVARRARQRRTPPDILMTTPEQLTLLLSHADSADLFADIDTVILDEIHALAATKRGDLLSLSLARLRALAPRTAHRRAVGDGGAAVGIARLSSAAAGAALAHRDGRPRARRRRREAADRHSRARRDRCRRLGTRRATPSARSTRRSRRHRLSLLFVNTRMQAELLFQDLWRINDLGLPIGLHHGSLDALQRRKVEAAMAAGNPARRRRHLDARSRHRLGRRRPRHSCRRARRAPAASSSASAAPTTGSMSPRRPSSCRRTASRCWNAGPPSMRPRPASRTSLSRARARSTCWRSTSSAPRVPATSIPPRCTPKSFRLRLTHQLTRETFDRVLGFVADGGYALKIYERYAKLKPAPDGKLRIAHPRFVQAYRMNAGTIVAAPLIKVRLVGRRAAATRKAMTAGASWARSTNTSSSSCARATPSCSPARCCALKA